MSVPSFIRDVSSATIKTIEMHTTGEPTRIVYSGYPDLKGTLLEQRAEARAHHDRIRKLLMCEPRGHREMYGAILRPETELTKSGEADIGVLFLTNEGYSTMCGHATIALGRLLVDAALSALPADGLPSCIAEKELQRGHDCGTVRLRLHAPCGLVVVTIPITLAHGGTWTVDTARQISYDSVPSFPTAIDISIMIPDHLRWNALQNRQVIVSVAYGGAFKMIVTAARLGLPDGYLRIPSPQILRQLDEATANLRQAFLECPENEPARKSSLVHPLGIELSALYSVIVVGPSSSDGRHNNLGVCFFADQQVDRSPTGSGVQARMALAYHKGEIAKDEPLKFHSPVSAAFEEGSFTGQVVKEVDVDDVRKGVVVRVSGTAKYTGCSTFIVEEGDKIGQGFFFENVGSQQ